MDGFRRYAQARVQAGGNKIDFHFVKVYFAVSQNVFAMNITFNWKKACSLMN
jgi:hypothetical protein